MTPALPAGGIAGTPAGQVVRVAGVGAPGRATEGPEECNIDVYTTLLAERGWTPDRVEARWTEALARELL